MTNWIGEEEAERLEIISNGEIFLVRIRRRIGGEVGDSTEQATVAP